MMGIPEEDHQGFLHWTNGILGFGDHDLDTISRDSRGYQEKSAGYATRWPRASRSTPRTY